MLGARGIPFTLSRFGRQEYIYTPALLEQKAKNEIAAYIKENDRQPQALKPWPLYKNWPLAPLYVLPLIVWQGMNYGWLAVPAILPQPSLWQQIGSLDAIQVILHGEWLRTATALTLHSGIVHLAGNVFFGAFFLALLARLCGVGHAWLLTCMGGVLGNCLSVLTHKLGYASIGFSTALFATVGSLAGILLWRTAEKVFMPFAAALAFLAMLGVEGANTDYAAHICGLFAGGLLGLFEGAALRHGWLMLPQSLAAAIALAIPVTAWWWSFLSCA